MPSTFDRVLHRSRSLLLRWVLSGTSTVVAFQRLCGVSSTAKSHSSHHHSSAHPSSSSSPFYRFLHFYFMTAAAVGNELFYIVAFPALFWLVDIHLARRMIVVWGLIYFFGQSAKDLYKLPRPPQPPVTRLETHYETEYGFPSTHAMVSFALPFYALLAWSRLDYSLNVSIGVGLASLWCASVTLSRLYVGVHSVCDLVGGLLLGAVVLLIGALVGEPIDSFIFHSPWAPLVVVLVSLLSIWSYPAPPEWTNAYGDTSLIIAVVAGVSVGQSMYFERFVSFNWGEYTAAAYASAAAESRVDDSLLATVQLNCGGVLLILIRLVVGCTILFLTRSLVKKVSHFLWLPFVLPKYFAYCSILPSPVASPLPSPSSAHSSAAKVAHTGNGGKGDKKHGKKASSIDASEESGEWVLTGVNQSQAAAAALRVRGGAAAVEGVDVAAGATVTAPSPSPAEILRPVPPQQFRLRIAVPADSNGISRTSSPSPLATLLSSSSSYSSASPSRSPRPLPHKLLLDPSDPSGKTTLVQFDVDGRPLRINPLHVYLVEIPIKYATYFAVGFNAAQTVPFIFNLLGI